jgi:putative DNA primase/helicase
MSDIAPEEVRWLCDGFLARGKLTLLGGDPDLGKSQIGIDAAARISNGLHWPNGPKAPIGSTLLLISEDGIADTVRPRIEAAGANLNKVHVMESTIIRNRKETRFSLQSDLDMLGAAIDSVGDVKLICIDALSSYVGKIDNNSQTDVRQVVDPLSKFAEQKGIAILGVTHPPKGSQMNAIRSFAGSFAYVASARLAFLVTKEPETDRRLMLCVKNNLGQKMPGKGYSIEAAAICSGQLVPRIVWDDAPVDVTADQAMAAAAASRRDRGAEGEAKVVLRDLLAEGPVDADEVKRAAAAECISERTLNRAKKALKIKSEKEPGKLDGKWQWRLP